MSRQVNKAYGGNSDYHHHLPALNAGSQAQNQISSVDRDVREPVYPLSRASLAHHSCSNSSNVTPIHGSPPTPNTAGTIELAERTIVYTGHSTPQSASHGNTQPRPCRCLENRMNHVVATSTLQQGQGMSTAASQMTFAERISPNYPDWDTLERALYEDRDPMPGYNETLGCYPHDITYVHAAVESSQQSSGSSAVPLLQSYRGDTIHQEGMHNDFFSPDNFVGLNHGPKPDSWVPKKNSEYGVILKGDVEIQYPGMYCSECGTFFSGQYARRNCERHVETEHDHRIFPCTECSRTYKRSDALLKHARKSHPELEKSPPILRKKSEEPPRRVLSSSGESNCDEK